MVLGLVGADRAYADTIFTESARTRDFNGQGLIPRFTYVHAGNTFDGNDHERDPLDRELRVYAATARGIIGLHEDVTLALTLPVVVKELRTRDASGRRIRLNAAGLADLAVVAKWRFFRDSELGGTTELAGLLGLELPSGRDDVRDGGTRLPQPLQPGSGSVDGIVGLAFTRVWDGGRWLVNADVFYKGNSEANDYRFGNELRFDVGGQLRVYPWRYEKYDQLTVNVIVELNGLYAERDTFEGNRIRDTGGLTLLASPGLQVIVNENLLVEAGVQAPIFRHLHGQQGHSGKEERAGAGGRASAQGPGARRQDPRGQVLRGLRGHRPGDRRPPGEGRATPVPRARHSGRHRGRPPKQALLPFPAVVTCAATGPGRGEVGGRQPGGNAVPPLRRGRRGVSTAASAVPHFSTTPSRRGQRRRRDAYTVPGPRWSVPVRVVSPWGPQLQRSPGARVHELGRSAPPGRGGEPQNTKAHLDAEGDEEPERLILLTGEGAELVRAFEGICSDERRQAILDYVHAEAEVDLEEFPNVDLARAALEEEGDPGQDGGEVGEVGEAEPTRGP